MKNQQTSLTSSEALRWIQYQRKTKTQKRIDMMSCRRGRSGVK